MTLTAMDLFAGAGGATQGLRDSGFDVRVAVELDSTAASTWVLNHPGVMIEGDVRTIQPQLLLDAAGLKRGELDLLKACPPCQGFSSLRGAGVDNARNDLVLDTVRLVKALEPRAILLENVPGLRHDHRYSRLVSELEELGYSLQDYQVKAELLGVPQRRRRLVVVATRGVEVPPDFDNLVPSRARRRSMTAGEMLLRVAGDPEFQPEADTWRVPKGRVAQRIAAIPEGGTRFDLPEHLRLDCHNRLTSKSGGPSRSAGGSYGRVRAAEAAPTMTTRCTTPACGAFIHPTENRGLSLREAASLQTFPASYKWAGNYGEIERQIGNAVPVWMAEALGAGVAGLLKSHAASAVTGAGA